jgi:hypothetical protein
MVTLLAPGRTDPAWMPPETMTFFAPPATEKPPAVDREAWIRTHDGAWAPIVIPASVSAPVARSRPEE